MTHNVGMIAVFATFLTGWVPSAFAVPVSYEGTFTVADFATGAQPDIQPSDVFHYNLTLDTSSPATGVVGNATEFGNAVTGFSLTRDAANAGSWDPSVGAFQLLPVDRFFANHASEFVSINIGGTGFPNANGFSFTSFQFSLPLAGVQDIQVGTAGDPLLQVFDGPPRFQDIASPSGRFQFNNGAVLVSGDLTILAEPAPPTNPIPEPASLALFGLGLAGLTLRARRQRDRVTA